MIEVFKWVSGINKGDIRDLLKLNTGERTQTNGFKLDIMVSVWLKQKTKTKTLYIPV